jgi:hypothetical protein
MISSAGPARILNFCAPFAHWGIGEVSLFRTAARLSALRVKMRRLHPHPNPQGLAVSLENGIRNRESGTLGSNSHYLAWLWENEMQTVVERVMKTYGMMVNLTVAQDQEARERLEAFLSDKTGSDHELAVQGLQFLRGSRSLKRRTICRINNAAKQVNYRSAQSS